MPASRLAVSIFLVIALALTAAFAQTRPTRQKPNPPKPAPTQPETTPEEPQDVDTLKTDTDLVTVPLIASDANNIYVTDLRQEEFAIFENGVQQQVAFFGKVAAPFHVVLMLDTSSSTQDKLKQIQQAAVAFVEQLQPADRVKVISFDDAVKDLNGFHQQSRNSALSDLQHDVRSRNESLRRGRARPEYDPHDSWPQGNRDFYRRHGLA
jgi:hypothetical protein